ncbi:MAG: glycosyltransferase family 9 protein [Bryobacteraceae bacterium]
MENTSSNELARQILECCLAGRPWPRTALQQLLQQATVTAPVEASRALFTKIVERLGDLFERRLCDAYAHLFSEVIAYVRPEFTARSLIQRYQWIRAARTAPENAQNIFVLSRITLGADVAVTSVIFDALKRRYPAATIHLVGPRKNWELFAADPRIRHYPFTYGRSGTLTERLSAIPYFPEGLVVDPDSRLSQLGLLPVCPEENYLFFESRSYGGDGEESLSALTSRWAAETFGVQGASGYIAPLPVSESLGVTISLGVGENQEKRIADPFEELLIAALLARGHRILIDKGAGGEETERVENVLARYPQVNAWQGDYAPFASRIARSRLYIGYDSAGQHVAAACGVPLVSIFAGYVSERMFQRWRPTGAGRIEVVKVTDADPAKVLAQTLENLPQNPSQT